MSEITRYVIVDAADVEGDTEYETFEQAREVVWLTQFQAEEPKPQFAVIARTYEYSDSELQWTTTGDDIWPPESEA